MTPRLVRLALLTSVAAGVPAPAQQARGPSVSADVSASGSAWQNRGSDIAVDPAWKLGTLSNGLRYAVRRADQPAGAISVRVRLGVGGLMEGDAQQGWSHLLEHMVFRGTAHVADGEGVKLWQRLGASFGSDTNAQTTLTATSFQLDLPHPGREEYGQAMAVLAEMMDSARIEPSLLATERRVVEAELAQRLSPLAHKIKDAQQPLFLAGTKAAVRDVIGTPETLANATASALKAYYETWYRPDNAVVVVTGDADPAMLEAGIMHAFGAWRASGRLPPTPDWGTPSAPAVPVATVTDPQAPDTLVLSFVAPHPDGPFTVARQQRQFVELVATRVLIQRLAAASREDKAIVNAGAQRAEQYRIEDQFIIAVQPKPRQWRAALEQAYGVINGVASHPPAQAEIDEQAATVANALDQAQRAATTQSAPSLATSFINDVDNGDVSGAREFYARLFAAGQPALTPSTIAATIRRLVAPAPRLLVMGPQPLAGGTTAAVAALVAAEKVAGGAAAELRSVSFDQLVLAGCPATATAPIAIPRLAAERVRLSNGVEMAFKRTTFERDRVRVRVDVGAGVLGEPRGEPGLWWTAAALSAAGIGPFSAAELARVTAGHQYGFAVAAGVDGATLTGATDASDLPGMLKLITAQLTQPRFDASVVSRLRESALANYASIYSQPGGVFQVFAGAALHGGDQRFNALPSRDAIGRLTLADFRRFWIERLAQGPVRVTIVGDVDQASATAAAAASLGTLGRRTTAIRQNEVLASAPAAPVTLTHRGDLGQVLVARVWPTLGDLDDRRASTALYLAATIIQTGLTEGFRATEGGSYSPIALHAQTDSLAHYGAFVAGAQVQTARVPEFRRTLDQLVADLASNGPSPDAFKRAQSTALSAAERNRENNDWWLAELSGLLTAGFTPVRISNVAESVTRIGEVSAAGVKAAVTRYLQPAQAFLVQVVPADGTSPRQVGKQAH